MKKCCLLDFCSLLVHAYIPLYYHITVVLLVGGTYVHYVPAVNKLLLVVRFFYHKKKYITVLLFFQQQQQRNTTLNTSKQGIGPSSIKYNNTEWLHFSAT